MRRIQSCGVDLELSPEESPVRWKETGRRPFGRTYGTKDRQLKQQQRITTDSKDPTCSRHGMAPIINNFCDQTVGHSRNDSRHHGATGNAAAKINQWRCRGPMASDRARITESRKQADAAGGEEQPTIAG
jgi:hypothetical protein